MYKCIWPFNLSYMSGRNFCSVLIILCRIYFHEYCLLQSQQLKRIVQTERQKNWTIHFKSCEEVKMLANWTAQSRMQTHCNVKTNQRCQIVILQNQHVSKGFEDRGNSDKQNIISLIVLCIFPKCLFNVCFFRKMHFQSCEMSQIWQIYLCKNIEKLG